DSSSPSSPRTKHATGVGVTRSVSSFLLDGRLEELDRFAQRLADVEAVLGRTGGPREPAEALDEPLHALDLARDDPAEVLEERMVVKPARDELGERLDGHDRVLDLVGD